jgi:hypothetical protein
VEDVDRKEWEKGRNVGREIIIVSVSLGSPVTFSRPRTKSVAERGKSRGPVEYA